MSVSQLLKKKCLNFFKKDEFRISEKIIDDLFINESKFEFNEKHNDIQERKIQLITENERNENYNFEYKACPVCSSKEYTLISKKDKYSTAIECCLCCGCGLIQLQPLPSQEILKDFKNNAEKQISAYGYEEAEKNNYELINYLEKNNLFNKLRKNSVIVAAGSHVDSTFDLMKHNYMEYHYIDYELDAKFFSYNNQEDFVLGSNFGDKLCDNSVSMLLYLDVFNQLIDLKAELEYAYRKIEDNGYLVFTLPGILNILTSSMGDILKQLRYTYFYYFDLDNLIELCSQNGFNFVCGNDEIIAVFQKKSEKEKQVKHNFQNNVKIKRYMRHDHKIMYLEIVNKIFKINNNKDYAIVIDSLLRKTNPYTGKIMVSCDELDSYLGERKVFLDDVIKFLNIFFNISYRNNFIYLWS